MTTNKRPSFMQVWIERMLQVHSPEFANLPEGEKLKVTNDLAKAEKWVMADEPTEFVARILLLARRMNVIDPEEWEWLWSRSSTRTIEWRRKVEVDIAFYVLGQSIRPWHTEQRAPALQWMRDKWANPALPPFSTVQHSTKAPQPQPQHTGGQSNPPIGRKTRDTFLAALLLDVLDLLANHADSIAADDDPVPVPVDPEWMDAADQAHIDDVARDILDGIDWGGAGD